MPRVCTSLAFINASFSIAVDAQFKVTTSPILAYGGINGSLVSASGKVRLDQVRSFSIADHDQLFFG